MGSSSMKVHPLARGFWDNNHEPQASLTLGCKRFRPLAPKVSVSHNNASLDLKSFIKPLSGPPNKHTASQQVETHPGGTRWNPTQEQIGILEMLYRGGMRTPNAQQIEQITEQLSKYGKIEGKNVFYWFQNHKARERQKQKRTILGLAHNPRTPTPQLNSSITFTLDARAESEEAEMSPYKKKIRSWTFERSEDKTLELFPLHPEGLLFR